MLGEAPLLAKPHVALTALIPPFPGVRHDVLVQVVPMIEAFVAYVALEPLLARVYQDVLGEVATGVE